jgi:hypothetical protein
MPARPIQRAWAAPAPGLFSSVFGLSVSPCMRLLPRPGVAVDNFVPEDPAGWCRHPVWLAASQRCAKVACGGCVFSCARNRPLASRLPEAQCSATTPPRAAFPQTVGWPRAASAQSRFHAPSPDQRGRAPRRPGNGRLANTHAGASMPSRALRRIRSWRSVRGFAMHQCRAPTPARLFTSAPRQRQVRWRSSRAAVCRIPA